MLLNDINYNIETLFKQVIQPLSLHNIYFIVEAVCVSLPWRCRSYIVSPLQNSLVPSLTVSDAYNAFLSKPS